MLAEPCAIPHLRLGRLGDHLVGSRDPVLLDDDPPVVADVAERAEEPWEVDVALAELAEDPAPPGLDHVGSVRDDLAQHVHPDVFDVDVVHARAPVVERLDRVRAADQEVARVDEEAEGGQLERALDLPRRLDVGSGVSVERRLEAARGRDVLRAADTLAPALPARFVEAERWVLLAAARVRAAGGRATVAEDGVRARRARRCEQVERAGELREILFPVLRLAEADRAPAARQLEAVLLEPRAKLALVTEVPGRAELGSGVAGRRDFGEQVVRPGDVRVDADGDLERAVGERRVRDPERHQLASPGNARVSCETVTSPSPTRAFFGARLKSSRGRVGTRIRRARVTFTFELMR